MCGLTVVGGSIKMAPRTQQERTATRKKSGQETKCTLERTISACAANCQKGQTHRNKKDGGRGGYLETEEGGWKERLGAQENSECV